MCGIWLLLKLLEENGDLFAQYIGIMQEDNNIINIIYKCQ